MINSKKARSIVSWVLTAVIAGQALLSSVSIAYGAMDNYGQLGSNLALGSPILDKTFTLEDWNKWEMICWGVFLSNFCTPIVDDYESTFSSTSSRGSKGAGYKALAFGTGSDPANAEVIQGLLNFAIAQQSSGNTKQVYVAYNEVVNGKIKKAEINTGSDSNAGGSSSEDDTSSSEDESSSEEDSSSESSDESSEDSSDSSSDDETSVDDEIGDVTESGMRPAKFRDMFLAAEKSDEQESWIEAADYEGVVSNGRSILAGSIGYKNIACAPKGNLPTFAVKYGTGYEIVFDYTESWDAQIMAAWLSRVYTSDANTDFLEEFNTLWRENPEVILDCFGNIVANSNGRYVMIVPAASNQYITENPSYNMLNSIIFNGYSSNLSGTELMLNGQQSVSGVFDLDWLRDIRYGGLPAFSSTLSNVEPGTILLYFDTDTIIYQDALGVDGKFIDGKDATAELSYGESLAKLFSLDLNNTTNPYNFKVESTIDYGVFSGYHKEMFESMIKASGFISNMSESGANKKILSTINMPQGDVKLFGDPVIVPVQMDVGRTKGKVNNAGVSRLQMNYIYEAYKKGKKSTAGDVSSNEIQSIFKEAKTVDSLKRGLFGDGKINTLTSGFIANRTDMFKLNVDPIKLHSFSLSASNPFKDLATKKVDGVNIITPKYMTSEGDVDYFPGRCVKAYPISEVMRSSSNVLGLREGTEFNTYSSFIYMTYLNWYGITGGNKAAFESKDKTSNFNTRIFDDKSDVLNVDISTLAKFKSEEDKKKEVLNYTYMMLHPTEGREYRNDLLMGAMADWIYETYQRIVYGSASTSYSNVTSNIATRNAAGFLNIDSYSENFMTAWLMKIYPTVALWIIGISILFIVITGIIKGRKISWFLISIILVINCILIVPSFGEVVPYISNNMVQKMFTDKMTFWGISESVTNATMEADYVNNQSISTGYMSSLSKEEQAQVVQLVKTFNVVYLDRALMLKNDISKKVTPVMKGNYAELQELQSARWMLPMIMRQFSANDMSANYVFTPLGDMYDNVSNMYWYYKPMDAINSGTINGQQDFGEAGSSGESQNSEGLGEAAAGVPIAEGNRSSYYPDYKLISNINITEANKDYRSISRKKDADELPHTYFYLLNTDGSSSGGKAIPLSRQQGFGGEYESMESYEKYIAASVASSETINAFKEVSNLIESDAQTYDSSDRSSIKPTFGYMWATENTFHYFYQSVKDSFDSYTNKGSASSGGEDVIEREESEGATESVLKAANGSNVGSVIGQLQGTFVPSEDGSTEVRSSFMHMGNTGKIKDIADLEEVFTNMMPYLYEMTITTGGTNGITGVFGIEKISKDSYKIYENNYKSWMFRSNWVIKIMENPQYTKPTKVKDKDGKVYDIKNPTLIDCYPEERPMVFSEAQMHVQGLTEDKLNLMELKCINVNNSISRKWTLLLNYANLRGMTKEVLFRQMATDAVMEFNKEFSPNSIMSGAYALYPQGLDLRAISFDSVMKMLMLNVTRDTSYIYGDTMKGIVEDSDIFTALLLLTSAFLCSYIIPLVRNVVLGAIFYLGLLAIAYTLLAGNKQKLKTSAGYLISNLLFTVMTIAYYLVFSTLMAVTTSDSVLTVQSVQVSIGNPVWCFIAVIAASLVYIYGIIKLFSFCIRHYRDMGMEVYTGIAAMTSEILSNNLAGLADKLSGNDTDIRSNAKGSSKKKDSITTTIDSGTVDVNIESNKAKADTRENKPADSGVSAYTYDKRSVEEGISAEEINSTIQKGKGIRKDS